MQLPLHEIVMKLCGPVTPIGCSHVDATRLENLVSLIDLTEKLVLTIHETSHYASSPEASVKKIGREAESFLYSLIENLDRTQS